MPALTLFIFCVGMGIGIGWTYGLIPLTYAPAKSGSLSPEDPEQEPLPPPNESSEDDRREAPDPEVFENQSEPEIDRHGARTARAASNENQSRNERFLIQDTTPKAPTGGLVSTSEWPTETPVERPSPAIRLRANRKTDRIQNTAANEETAPDLRTRPVRAAAYQEPDSSSEERDASREKATASGSAREQLAAAEEKLAAGETLAAHRDFSKLYWNHKELRPAIQETIDSTAKAIFFQSKPNYIEPYVIQDGERLEVIAKKYQLSWEYLAKLNRTEPRRIQIGQKLKVVKGPFGAVVDLKDFALTVHLQGYYVKRYSVGIGKDGSSPIGKFAVLNKVENPAYTAPNGKVIPGDDPANPLGERWIDLGESYGIHGTIDPDSIGKAESRGCIRLRDSDIIEVYDFLVKGSEVSIRK